MERLPSLITFTGVDDHTSIPGMVRLTQLYPGLVEWGVLVGGAGRRYPSEALVSHLSLIAEQDDLPIALHLCGAPVWSFLGGTIRPSYSFKGFSRIQLNSSTSISSLIGDMIASPPSRETPPLIVQVRDGELPPAAPPNLQYLFDSSQGRGLLPGAWPAAPPPPFKVGFAGGINPANVLDVLDSIPAPSQRFWLDMESGVRTDNHFDLEKVEAVLRRVFAFEIHYTLGPDASMPGPAIAGPFAAEHVQGQERRIRSLPGFVSLIVQTVRTPTHMNAL